ncbi:hypothetical protein GE09DRAFT_1122020 [Coniochaeta sp. 2T2.1]|nr:hypothetical protein GE09DRAFT_1122020 [Coniochaeta sp. 2T2.1]
MEMDMDLLSWVSQPNTHVGDNVLTSEEAMFDEQPSDEGERQMTELLRMDVDKQQEAQDERDASDAPSVRPELEPVTGSQEPQDEDRIVTSDFPFREPEVQPADSDVDIQEDEPESESEPAATKPVCRVDIVVELPITSLERRNEFVLVDEPDDGFEGDQATYDGTDGSLKRKLAQDAEYDDVAEEDDYLSSESQHLFSNERHSGRASGRTTRQASRISENEDDDEIILDRPRRSRTLRPRNATAQSIGNTSRFGNSDDIDELAQEPEDLNSDGDFVLIQSDLQPRRPAKRRKKSSRMISLKGKGPKDGIEFEAPRRSGRANKAAGSMFETFEDDEDFYIEDDRTPGAPKVVAVKEIYQPLTAKEAGFKDVHNPNCNTCDTINPNRGTLIYCQGCSFSYHKVCLGQRAARDHLVTKIGQESFVLQCRNCINFYKKKERRAPDLARCQTCHEAGKSCKPFSERKTAKQEEQLRLENDGEDPIHKVNSNLINNAETCLFRCTQCRRGFHFEHLPAPDNASNVTSDTDTLRTKNIEEYSVEWKCKDCIDMPGKVDALIAWRPVDRENYAGQSYSDYGEDQLEYLVKWEKQSHRHCLWKPGSWVWGATHGSMRSSWAKRVIAEGIGPKFDEKDAIPEELTMIDVILAVQYKDNFRPASKKTGFQSWKKIKKVYVKFIGLGYDEAVWDDPPPPDSGKLFEEFLAAYDEHLTGVFFADATRSEMLDRIKEFRALDFAKDIETTDQPTSIQNGELMGYQISGVNWLKYNYHKQHNAILADEMGLGKTVQIVALLADLVKVGPRVWPFLVVVPNSTVPNWRREIKKWAPDLRVVTYHGGKQAQDLAFNHELFPRDAATIKAHIVVMSYEAAQDPATRPRFRSVHFAGLIVDEGHRLKNDQNLLYAALMAMKIPYRVLLTGTPLQNNKRELFNLLQFLNPKLDAAKLDEEYGELTAENIPKLHDTIRPYFLRRTKADTLKFLPKMARVIIPVTMTVLQEKLSRSIMSKNGELIHAILAKGKLKATERGSLNNILMQLRKCLCHPFIYSTAIEDRVEDQVKQHNNLVEASAKLLLLELMLPKLKEQGHRVLLFSQFLDQLDIMEDFLTGIGLTFSRIDGSISSLEKQKRIDAYNAPDSPIFAMLLSTRAGGVGINLATADTVIILDPDFNPHQDLQAVSRCHRIGQRKPVLCFQITTKDSVEEKILQAGRKKMALDHALIETMDEQKDEVYDLESILKHGAAALFSDAKRDKITYDPAAVDKLLDRERLIAEQNPPGAQDDAFSFAPVWENGAGEVGIDNLEEVVDPVVKQSVWEAILREREEQARLEAEANKETLGRGARRRGKAIQYSANRDGAEDGQEDGAPGEEDMPSVDEDFVGSGAESDGDSAEEEAAGSGSVTPPGELTEKGARGKKPKGIASQDTHQSDADEVNGNDVKPKRKHRRTDGSRSKGRGTPSADQLPISSRGPSQATAHAPGHGKPRIPKPEQPRSGGSKLDQSRIDLGIPGDGILTLPPSIPASQPAGRPPAAPSSSLQVQLPARSASQLRDGGNVWLPATRVPATGPPVWTSSAGVVSVGNASPAGTPGTPGAGGHSASNGSHPRRPNASGTGSAAVRTVGGTTPPIMGSAAQSVGAGPRSSRPMNGDTNGAPAGNLIFFGLCLICDEVHGPGIQCPSLNSKSKIRIALDELNRSAKQGKGPQDAIAIKRKMLKQQLEKLELQRH